MPLGDVDRVALGAGWGRSVDVDEIKSHALEWRISTKSAGGNCVEVAIDGDRVHVRNSRRRGGLILSFSREHWQHFIHAVKEGEILRQQ
jgi:hypothetical protein